MEKTKESALFLIKGEDISLFSTMGCWSLEGKRESGLIILIDIDLTNN